MYGSFLAGKPREAEKGFQRVHLRRCPRPSSYERPFPLFSSPGGRRKWRRGNIPPHCATRNIVYSLIRAHEVYTFEVDIGSISSRMRAPCMLTRPAGQDQTRIDQSVMVDLSQTHHLSDQGFAQEEHLASPLDLPVGADPTDFNARPVFNLRQTLWEPSLRCPVALRRRLHPQGLVRPQLIVLVPEPLQGPLLGPQRRFGRLRHGLLERFVHSLMAGVFLRMTQTDSLRPDPEPHPPDRQPRQASQSHAGEGRAIVGTNRPGQSVLPKGPLELRPHMPIRDTLRPVAVQQIPAHPVRDRQRVDPAAITGLEPALEVRRPDVVGADALMPRAFIARRPPTHSARLRQAVTLQNLPGRTLRRPLLLGVFALQPRQQLARSPLGMALTQSDNPRFNRRRRQIGMLLRGAAPLQKTGRLVERVALKPLVGRGPCPPSRVLNPIPVDIDRPLIDSPQTSC